MSCSSEFFIFSRGNLSFDDLELAFVSPGNVVMLKFVANVPSVMARYVQCGLLDDDGNLKHCHIYTHERGSTLSLARLL